MSILILYFKMLLLSIIIIKRSEEGKVMQILKNLTEYSSGDACRSRLKLITYGRNEDFELVEASVNTTVTLSCHFCEEADDNAPKLWYRQSRFHDSNVTEVEIGTEDELASNRVYMKPDHTLVFNRTIEEDAALYYCSGRLGEQKSFKFNYLLDIVNPTPTKVTLGNMKDWSSFQEKYFTKINEKFIASNRSDYAFIRSSGVLIEAIGKWQPWRSCDGCAKIRIRISECRLQPSLMDRNVTWKHNLSDSEALLLNSFEMSCYSLEFRKVFPNISDDLADIGCFAVTEPCYAPCKVDGHTKSSARYRNTVVLSEGDHFTIICPEVTVKSEVRWEKDGIALGPNIEGGNVIIDSFSNLYIIYATAEEEANYTCYVDDVKMQLVSIYVRQQFVITSQAFFRHFKYLGFIFIFSGIFYSAGMILSWNRRHTFKKLDFVKIAEERFALYRPDYDIF